MVDWTFILGSDIAAGCVDFDEPGNSVWFGTANGEIRSLRLLDDRETVHGQGYGPLATLILSPNALGIDVVQQDERCCERRATPLIAPRPPFKRRCPHRSWRPPLIRTGQPR
jgi:hypothetical protein